MQIIRRTASASKRLMYEIDTEEYDMKPLKGRVAIFDTETDPFAEGRIVRPFTCGFYIPDSDEYFDFWGDDCIDQFFTFLAESFPEVEFSIFVHNGGGFDFYFITDYFDEGMAPFIINGRLVRITCRGHEFRDSYAMVPVALGNALSADDGGKIEINYAKLEQWFSPNDTPANVDAKRAYAEYVASEFAYVWIDDTASTGYSPREYWRNEICKYQKQDCIALGKLVVGWLDMFGNRLTMASVALPMLRSYHGFENMSEATDETLRPYYFGGRCQAFETGILEGKFYGFDITSSYPDVMRRVKHPISDAPLYEKRITNRTHFARIRAWSNGALPIRKKDGGLAFPVGTADFFACIHEIKAGLETGTLRIHHVYETMYFEQESTFDNFIDTFFKLRQEAGAAGDEVKKLFYKLVMNSSYGKFAQDPRKYESWLFDPVEIPTPLFCAECNHVHRNKLPIRECAKCEAKTHDAYGWYLHTERDGKAIYARPNRIRSGSGFFNVATAASITSAARASLLYAINASKRPIYCDTDSLICEALEPDPLGRVIIDNKMLGAWKLEFQADKLGIGGKKLYVCTNEGVEVKKAHKGVKLTGEQIFRICAGETIEYANPVPKFSLFKGEGKNTVKVNEMVSASFVSRRIKATGGEVQEVEF